MFFTSGRHQVFVVMKLISNLRFEIKRGAIAQLVERLLCKQDVDSSNLSGSTIRRVPFWGLAHGRSLFNAANTLSLSKGLYKTN